MELKVQYLHNDEYGQPVGGEHEGIIESESIFPGVPHSRVYRLLASLNTPENREGLIDEWPELNGQAHLLLLGYKRPEDPDWNPWRQTLYAANRPAPKPVALEESPHLQPSHGGEMAQGVERHAAPAVPTERVEIGENTSRPPTQAGGRRKAQGVRRKKGK